jgi:hypothetical protein
LDRSVGYFVVIAALLALLLVLSRERDDVPSVDGNSDSTFVVDLPSSESRTLMDDQIGARSEKPIGQPTTGDVNDAPPRHTEPNILAVALGLPFPEVESPPWADEMENSILAYVAQHPRLELTALQVQCGETACVIYMAGDSVPVYEMNFDVFAAEQGFESAGIHSIDGGPRRIVTLRAKQ